MTTADWMNTGKKPAHIHEWFRKAISETGCCWWCLKDGCDGEEWVPRAADGSFPAPKSESSKDSTHG